MTTIIEMVGRIVDVVGVASTGMSFPGPSNVRAAARARSETVHALRTWGAMIDWYFDGLALALLVALQCAITWSSVRMVRLRHPVTGDPIMLLHRGALVSAALRETRTTADDVRAAVRSAGIADLATVEAVVLETDGSLSVVRAHGSGA